MPDTAIDFKKKAGELKIPLHTPRVYCYRAMWLPGGDSSKGAKVLSILSNILVCLDESYIGLKGNQRLSLDRCSLQ